jgi:hypothetical protein
MDQTQAQTAQIATADDVHVEIVLQPHVVKTPGSNASPPSVSAGMYHVAVGS